MTIPTGGSLFFLRSDKTFLFQHQVQMMMMRSRACCGEYMAKHLFFCLLKLQNTRSMKSNLNEILWTHRGWCEGRNALL